MKSPCQTRHAAALSLVMLGLTTEVLSAEEVRRTPAVPRLEAPSVEHFPTAASAFASLLAIPARVLAVGEYHQTLSRMAIPSSLARFTDEILPLLAQSSTDLVVETWVADGQCGADEAAVERDVQTTTQRPAETGNEIVALLRRARAVGLRPHVLSLSCRDYASVTDAYGHSDFVKMLGLTRRRLEARVLDCLHEPTAVAHGEAGARPPGRVVVYGGALHNDLYPAAADAGYAFGRSLWGKTRGEYLEIDLLVPEYVLGDRRLAAEPWFRLFEQSAKTHDALRIRRSARSYVILFPPSKSVDNP